MDSNHLNLSRASDLKNPKERFLYRGLEMLPGFLSLGAIILAFLLSWLLPAVVAVFIIAFDFLWLLRTSYLSLHQLSSYCQLKKNLRTNWLEKLENLKNKEWKNIYHLILLPFYKEGMEIVRPTLQSLVSSNYPKDKMIVVLSVEERAGESAQKIADDIEKEFGKIFFRYLTTVHPQNIPGEIAGKGSNIALALKASKEFIIDRAPQKLSEGEKENKVLFDNKLSIPYENIIVSNFDIDTRPYPQYFAVLTWHYLTSPKPLKSSYQPVPIYNNNIWQAPAFSRVIATSGTFWQMMQQERAEQLVTYSSQAMPFKTIIEVGYPNNMVSDDSRIFWKSYLYYNGDYRVIPLHYPVSMDAVLAKNLPRTIINQYKQQRRWGWGCENIPYIIYGFLKNKKIPFGEKLFHTFIILDGFWSWAVTALLIFFLGWLPFVIGGEAFQISLLSYNLPKLTSKIMTVAMFGMIISAIMSMLLLPARPKNFNKLKNLSMFFQWLLFPITLIFFGGFPALEAQVRLMLGKRLGFYSTEKVRK